MVPRIVDDGGSNCESMPNTPDFNVKAVDKCLQRLEFHLKTKHTQHIVETTCSTTATKGEEGREHAQQNVGNDFGNEE
eukprot:391829-Prorocentrum_lima.AAC.1